MHIYEWIDKVISNTAGEARARAFLDFRSRSASYQMTSTAPIKNAVITCIYEGKQYRITGCSRLGDVWLHKDLKANISYTKRVNIEDCSQFKELI